MGLGIRDLRASGVWGSGGQASESKDFGFRVLGFRD